MHLRSMEDVACRFGYRSTSKPFKSKLSPTNLARHAVTAVATRLRSAADTQLREKGVIHLEIQRGQRMAKASVLVVTNLATDMILVTAYINENIEGISLMKARRRLLAQVLSQ